MIIPDVYLIEGWHLVLTHRGGDGSLAYRYLPRDPEVFATPFVVFLDPDGQRVDVVPIIEAFTRLEAMEPVDD